MSQAVKLIVGGYVKMQDRHALEALRDQRRRLLAELGAVTGISAVSAIEAVQVDLQAIETGLQELRP